MAEVNRALAIAFTICAAPLALVDLTILRTVAFLLLSSVTTLGAFVFLLFVTPPTMGAIYLGRLWRRPMALDLAAQHGVRAILMLMTTPVMYLGMVLFALSQGSL